MPQVRKWGVTMDIYTLARYTFGMHFVTLLFYTKHEKAWHMTKYANMWRITDDFWDDWC